MNNNTKQERIEITIPSHIIKMVGTMAKEGNVTKGEIDRILYINGVGRFIHHWSLKNKDKIAEVIEHQKIHNEITWFPIIDCLCNALKEKEK